MNLRQRTEFLLFTACFFAFAYFNQGGGWNQNARFAEVRAMVEERRFAIDHFLVYERNAAGFDLVRRPVDRAEFTKDGQRYRLCWVDMQWNLSPVGEHPLEPGVEKAAMIERCSSGDIAYVPHTGKFHPNKPPGTSFFGVPAYAMIYGLERLCGINPDAWWTLEMNAWLTSVFSVGVVSALGCVLFFRLATHLAGGALWPAAAATIAFAFGTTFFPFSTLLIDHDLTASLLVAALYFLFEHRRGGHSWSARHGAWMAGLCAGMATLTNYVAVGAVAMLGLYALSPVATGQRWAWRRAFTYCLGGLGPLLLLSFYSMACFGHPLRPNTDFQNPLFKDTGAILGMFNIPKNSDDILRLVDIALLLTISPYRGLFWFGPVLLLGVWGAWVWIRDRHAVSEARVCLGIFAFFYLVNVTFNGFHSGFAAGPRYMVPGIPFLALPLVVAFARARWLAAALAAISIFFNLLLTATDAQNPVGVGGHARVEGRRVEWTYSLVGDYAWPLFAHGRAWPLLNEQIDLQVEKSYAEWDDANLPPAERQQREAALRTAYRESIARGEASPFLLGSLEGPVSVNPVGVYEGLFTYGYFPPKSAPVRWASFNLGELLWPSLWERSRWSLLPLLLVSGGLCWTALRLARRADAATSRNSALAAPAERVPQSVA